MAIDFDPTKLSIEDLISAANVLFSAEEKDFMKIKSEKWYATLFHAITLNQDGKKYIVRDVKSLAQLQRLFMYLYVKNYRQTHEQLDIVVDNLLKQSAAMKKMYNSCILRLEAQGLPSELNSKDANILAVFLGKYRNSFGEIPEKVKQYNKGVLLSMNGVVPNGDLDNHQLRKLDQPHIVYKCFMEQCAIDETIDIQEWPNEMYEVLRDIELGERSKEEIKSAVKREAEIAGVDFFLFKYHGKTSDIFDDEISFEIFEFNGDVDTEHQNAACRDAINAATSFYSKQIVLVYTTDTKDIAGYFLGVLNSNKNKLESPLPTPICCKLKDFAKNQENIDAEKSHIILLGDSKEAKKIYPHTHNEQWDYYSRFGMRFITRGNKTVLLTRKIENVQIDDFISFARKKNEKHPMKIPGNVKTIKYSVMKEYLSKNMGSSSNAIKKSVATAIGLPSIVWEQTCENVENSLQFASNIAAADDLEFLQYCVAIYEYLDSEKALLD